MTHDTGGREAIVDAAAKLFNREGYKGASIRDIARACGVTNAALYYHFKNKDDLYLAVLRRSHARIMQSVSEAAALAGDPATRLKRLILRYAEVMCNQRQSFQTLRRDLAHIDKGRAGKWFVEMRSEFMRPIHEAIESAQAAGQIVPGDARLFGRLLHGMIIALTFEGGSRRPRLTPGEADTLVDVFLNGVLNRSRKAQSIKRKV